MKAMNLVVVMLKRYNTFSCVLCIVHKYTFLHISMWKVGKTMEVRR